MALLTTGLKTHIWNNNLKSMLLLGLYPVLILGVFWVCAALMGVVYTDIEVQAIISFANNAVYKFWPSVIGAVALWFIFAWFFHSNMIRKLARSNPVSRAQEPDLYNLLENLSITAGTPMPRLEIVETHARNAFASGLGQKTYTVTVTRGLMNSLSKEEMEGVLAHELTHILNRDVRLLIITVIFTGMIGFSAQMVWTMLRHGYVLSGRDGKERLVGYLIMFCIAAVLSIGYSATLLMRFAISRRREYMADAGAVELTKNAPALMRALMRISGRAQIPEASGDIAMMCIENGKSFLGLFRTHPPIDRRIQALADISGEDMPQSASLPPIHPDQAFGQIGMSANNPWIIRTRGTRKKTPWDRF